MVYSMLNWNLENKFDGCQCDALRIPCTREFLDSHHWGHPEAVVGSPWVTMTQAAEILQQKLPWKVRADQGAALCWCHGHWMSTSVRVVEPTSSIIHLLIAMENPHNFGFPKWFYVNKTAIYHVGANSLCLKPLIDATLDVAGGETLL